MKTINKSFYGDGIRWFVGTVIVNNDPAEMGRVRVRIDGVHSPNTGDIKENDLPWAMCMLPTTEGGTSGLGFIPQLQGGAKVFGLFLDGPSSQIPMIIGSLPKVEYPSRAQIIANANNPSSSIDLQQTSAINTRDVNRQLAAFSAGSLSFKDLPTPDDPTDDNFSLAKRRLQAMKFFLDNYNSSPEICAGIVGNLQAESNFDTKARGDLDTSSVAIGIAQWRLDRKDHLRNFANTAFNSPKNPENFAVQLAFIIWELKNSSYVRKAAGFLPKCDTYLGGTVNNNSTYIFARYYEKCNRIHRTTPALAKTREKYAHEAITDLLNNT